MIDTRDWYGWDEDGAGVHDVIGTRCDPYTNLLLKGEEYHHCCHSNLTRALAAQWNLPLDESEVHVHDVMNVFMCTGYIRRPRESALTGWQSPPPNKHSRSDGTW
jgi:uncharacterized protein YcgI (DUF1989 family)